MKRLRTWKSDMREMASEDYIIPDNVDNLEFLNMNIESLYNYDAKYVTQINEGIVCAYAINYDRLNNTYEITEMDKEKFIKEKFGHVEKSS